MYNVHMMFCITYDWFYKNVIESLEWQINKSSFVLDDIFKIRMTEKLINHCKIQSRPGSHKKNIRQKIHFSFYMHYTHVSSANDFFLLHVFITNNLMSIKLFYVRSKNNINTSIYSKYMYCLQQ